MDNIDNILMPERDDSPITHSELETILTTIMEAISQVNSDTLLNFADILSNYVVRIRNEAEYNRLRDLRFMINLVSQMGNYDKNVLYTEYERWCDEFDRLNKPQDIEGEKDE